MAILPLALSATGCRGPERHPAAVRLPSVQAEVATVSLSETPDVLTVPGTVRAEFNTTLASKVMGRVSSVHVREGDALRPGQILVMIDSRELAAQVVVAEASRRSAEAGVGTAQTSAEMEAKTSQARVLQAEGMVQQAQAQVATARARYDLALAGPRAQEVAQTKIAVEQAASTLKLASTELERVRRLADAGVVALRELDNAQNRYDLALGQHDSAVQAHQIAVEGSRIQELRSAKEGVSLAEAALRQAKAGAQEAKAASLQTEVRKKQVVSAQAQARQAAAVASAARVGLSYSRVTAPFAGRVVARLTDPGALASPGSPLLTVEGGEFRLVAEVPERHIGSVRPGDEVDVSIDSIPGRTFAARVAEIVPSTSADRHSFTVRFGLPNAPGVRSGVYGRAELRVGGSAKLLVPLSAIWQRDGLHFVMVVVADGTARLRIVTVGQESARTVHVLSGLKPGERIVLDRPESVPEGSPVEAKRT